MWSAKPAAEDAGSVRRSSDAVQVVERIAANAQPWLSALLEYSARLDNANLTLRRCACRRRVGASARCGRSEIPGNHPPDSRQRAGLQRAILHSTCDCRSSMAATAQRYLPLARVGISCRAGRRYPSTVLMTAVPAQRRPSRDCAGRPADQVRSLQSRSIATATVGHPRSYRMAGRRPWRPWPTRRGGAAGR